MIGIFAAATIGAVLYRLRGGWLATLTGWRQPTQLMRAVWAVPTAGLLALCFGASPLIAAALVGTVFASLALIGHGAHMVMDAERFVRGSSNKTELLTGFWLPRLFGGVPEETWLVTRARDVTLYNIAGMSSIGLVRNIIAVAPLFWIAPIGAALYAATGLLHGPLYWVGWRIDDSSAAGELLVGGLSWAAIAMLRG